MFTAPHTIDRGSPRAFCDALLEAMSKRDKDDFSRLTAKFGEAAFVRYFAARHMDPYFCNVKQEAAFKRFGEALEDAYQALRSELSA